MGTTGLGWPETKDPGARGSIADVSRRSGLGWPDDTGADVVEEDAPASGEAAPATGRQDDLVHSTDAAESGQAPIAEDVPRETEPVPPPLEAEVEDDSDVVFDQVPRPVRTRTLVVANQKGGVGKTTTAVNLAAALAGSGCRVLVVDLDPQGNASTAFNIEHHDEVPSVYESLIDTQPLGDVVHTVRRFPSLFAVPATIDLSGAELELVSVIARESRLKKALEIHCGEQEAAGQRYDYVLIDCPPSLGLLTINALVAGDEVLVPIQCEYYALEGVGALWRTIERVRTQLNPQLQISTVLLTMYDARTRLSAQVADEVRSNLGDAVLDTVIPRSVRISEAPSFQQTVLTWDPNSPGALSYLNAAREIAGRYEPL
ncbi:ParA family protein [Flindersiella endophytica]